MLGAIYSAGMGWLVISRGGWRLFIGLTSIPAWMCTLLTVLLLPESPRFLLVHGRATEAAQVWGWLGDGGHGWVGGWEGGWGDG